MGGRVTVSLRYIDQFQDRHGRMRYYFRRPGGHRVRLPGLPGTPEFTAAYHEALATLPAQASPVERWQPKTLSHLAALYFQTSKFKGKKDRTRYVERLEFERFLKEHGHRPALTMQTRHLDSIFAAMSDRPMAAMSLRKRLRNLTRLMVKLGWRQDDPINATDTFKGGTIHSWTEEEVAQFQAHWKLGTKQRLAFDLHIFTGQRRSDVHRMTWADIKDGRIRVKQFKGGATLMLPLHRELVATLQARPREHVSILVNELGRPFTVAGYGNWIGEAIKKAGLPARCRAHGLRKAAGARLADVGCSMHEIAAILGHKTLKEVARYTAAADQGRLADSAIARLEGQTVKPRSQTEFPNLKIGNQNNDL